MSQVKEMVKEFVVENYLFGDSNGLRDDTSLLEEGIIDSTSVLGLVNFLEETLEITVSDEELIPDNLDSLNKIAGYVGKKVLLNSARP